MKQTKMVLWSLLICVTWLGAGPVWATTPHHDLTVDVFESDTTTAIGGATVKYTKSGSAGIVTLGTTNAFGRLLGVGMAPGTYTIWVEYAFSRSASQTVEVTGSNWEHLKFYTVEAAILVEDSDHNPIQNAHVKYGPSYIGTFGYTGPDGKARKELFAGVSNFKYLVTYHWTTSPEQWAIVNDADPMLTFTTTTVNFCFSGKTQVNSSGLHDFVSPIELFEGTVNFRFEIGPWDDKKVGTLALDVTGAEVTKTIALLCLLDHTGAPLAGGTARGGNTTPTLWHVSGSTDSSGVLLDCRNGCVQSLAYEMKFNNTTGVEGPKDPTADSYFEFKTVPLTLRLETCLEAPLDGGKARYGVGSTYTTWWFPGGVTGTSAPGETVAEVFPGTYSFEMQYQATAQTQLNVVVPDTGTTLTWQTSSASLHCSHPITYGGASGDSQHFTSPMELLPGRVLFNFHDPLGDVRREIAIKPCTYEKTVAIVRVHTSDGIGRPDYSGVWYVAGPQFDHDWGPTDAEGIHVILVHGLPTNDTTVCLNYGSKTDSLTQPADTDSTYVFVPTNTLVVSANTGGDVTAPGVGSYTYDHNTEVVLDATLDDHYHYLGWTGTAVDAGKVADPTLLATTVLVDDDFTLAANFEIDKHTLCFSSSAGGAVTNPGEGEFVVDYGTTVLIETLIDDPLFSFNGFVGTLAGGEGRHLLVVEHDHDIRATFQSSLDILYVDDNAPNDVGPYNLEISDPNENGTADQPFDSIQEAVEVAKSGATVVVLSGTYPESVTLSGKSLTLTSDHPDPNVSVLDYPVIQASGDTPAITFDRCSDLVLKGFVLTGGNGNSACGVRCQYSDVLVQNCLIVGNRRLTSAMAGGGGLWCFQSQVVLANCTLADNYGGTGGAGLYAAGASDVTVIDSILYENLPAEILVGDGCTVTVATSNVAGGYAGDSNLDVDPAFVTSGHWEHALDPGMEVLPSHSYAVYVGGDYHLSSGSPCIDAGDPLADYSQEPEPNGGVLNMGAYGNTPQATTTTMP